MSMMHKMQGSHIHGQSVSAYDGEDTETNTTSKTNLKQAESDVKHRPHGTNGHHIHNFARLHGNNSSHVDLALQEEMNKDLLVFDTLLTQSTNVLISTQKKMSTDVNLIGKLGYDVTSPTGQKLGFLISEAEPSCLDKLCCAYVPAENDPISYYIASPSGKELISIYGLDDDIATEDTVMVTRLKCPIGTVTYGYLGASDTISRATSYAGRDGKFMIPTAVTDRFGDLRYIFRAFPLDDVVFTELLTADGMADTIAEIMIDDLVLKMSEVIHIGESIPQHHLPAKKTKVFSIKFIVEMPPEDKSLVIGVAVTIFNRWLTRRKSKSSSCVIL